MAISLKEFIELTGAEVVAGRVIVGVQAERKFVGEVSDGRLSLDDAGRDLLAKIEEEKEAAKVETAKAAKAEDKKAAKGE